MHVSQDVQKISSKTGGVTLYTTCFLFLFWLTMVLRSQKGPNITLRTTASTQYISRDSMLSEYRVCDECPFFYGFEKSPVGARFFLDNPSVFVIFKGDREQSLQYQNHFTRNPL